MILFLLKHAFTLGKQRCLGLTRSIRVGLGAFRTLALFLPLPFLSNTSSTKLLQAKRDEKHGGFDAAAAVEGPLNHIRCLNPSKSLRAFREGEIDVLVASDAMTHGMDAEGVRNASQQGHVSLWALLYFAAKTRVCLGLESIPEGDWICRYCQNMHRREKCVECNKNAIVVGRVASVDPFEEIFKRCIRVLKTPETDVGGCVFCSMRRNIMLTT